MATPAEVLQRILANLASQNQAGTSIPVPNQAAPVVPSPPVAPGVAPTTTTGLGVVAPVGTDLTALLQSTLAGYQQGGQNVGAIYDSTNQQFQQPGNDFLLKLIESLMAEGFTEDQIMSDQNVMSYIQNLNNLTSASAQNEATDLSWFEKLGNLSTAALAQGAILGGGSGGGGGGGGRGGGGRRGYGGGGYRRGGYRRYGGGGGYGDGDNIGTMKTDETLTETATETALNYAPGFYDTLIEAAGGDPELEAALDRIAGQFGGAPRDVRSGVIKALPTIEATIAALEASALPAVERQRSYIDTREQRRADTENALRQAALEAFRQQQNRKAKGNPGLLEQAGSLLSSGPDSPWAPNVSGRINLNPASAARAAATRAYTSTPEYQEQFIENWIKNNSKNLPIRGSLGDSFLRKIRYDEQGNPVGLNPAGKSIGEMLEESDEAEKQREAYELALEVATQFDPNVSPNITKRELRDQAQSKSRQTAYGEDYYIGENQGGFFEPYEAPVATGPGTARRGYIKNPATEVAKLRQLAARRTAAEKAPQANWGNRTFTDLSGYRSAVPKAKLSYENGGYRVRVESEPPQPTPKSKSTGDKVKPRVTTTRTPVRTKTGKVTSSVRTVTPTAKTKIGTLAKAKTVTPSRPRYTVPKVKRKPTSSLSSKVRSRLRIY